MPFFNALFNVFTDVFDVMNCSVNVQLVHSYVHQKAAVGQLFLYSIIRYELCLYRSAWYYAKFRC